MSLLEREAARRRTHAIISHPDAGKTTLTEKLLLYAGAIHLAGSVKSRKASRHALSDFMKIEQERGISVSSTVLQFEYHGSAINLLDTPGHADFSEDTYRTLAAVDSAVMLLDHTKGVEARTLKLFEVCRMRMLPIVTFMNKLDRVGKDPIELLDEVRTTLNLNVVPMNWPLGMGREFEGVIDIATNRVYVYSGGKHGTEKLETEIISLDEARERFGNNRVQEAVEQIELIAGAGDPFTREGFLAGHISPVFWGSAMTNFGVEPLLSYLADHAAPPAMREATRKNGETFIVEPDDERFTGVIFKIQANMNPKHRDRIAFMRCVSGRFRRGMDVILATTGEVLRLSNPHTFMAQERSIVDDAFPGDIVGLYDPGKLRIGETLVEDTGAGKEDVFQYKGIPRFAPEFFVRVVLKDPLRRKQLDQGLEQLSQEGVIQAFYRDGFGRGDPYLGAVGLLQFEVLRERLESEYGARCILETQPFGAARWVRGPAEALEWLRKRRDYTLVEDRRGNPVVLVQGNWALEFARKNATGIELYDVEPL